MSFAAFIMTYKRPNVAQITITKLFEQTRKPEKVLIIDNDPKQSGKILMERLSDLPLEYFPMNYNAGPAGAAAKGLEVLANQGFDWIAWIDDDDPPIYNDSFEILLNTALQDDRCGSVGAVGQFVNLKTGLIKIVPDQMLKGEGYIEVDTIAGGMLKIMNGNMVRTYKLLPDKDLFFGFEELDIDLKIKSIGFKLFAPKDLYRRHREYFKSTKKVVIQNNRNDIHKLWRLYYSLRNILYVLSANKLYTAFFLTTIRYIFRIFYSFRLGWMYGYKNFNLTIKAFFHFISNKKGILS